MDKFSKQSNSTSQDLTQWQMSVIAVDFDPREFKNLQPAISQSAQTHYHEWVGWVKNRLLATVVGKPRDDHVAPCMLVSPLSDPAVEDIMMVHVSEQW
ncbi:hypothetical protein AXFE_36690 [Acidithrix ferrooxidans]|uniref:Uncharacterized protein n=1 Tax=Acidithrix ferrooxidans TaxID=1280514 RepID=A0A0D8HEL9_9ACTN|nr:hypothetical protein AXFE_36690 [Acidithrix ferrooxidans]